MKRTLMVTLLVLLLVPVFMVTGYQSAEAKTIKLTYSNFFPPTHIQSILAEAWCKEVEMRTKGQVKIDYYPGQTLTKAKQNYDGVVTGQSDLGLCLFAYNRGRFPVMAAVDLPLGYTSGNVATRVVNAVYEKFMPKELMDTKVMYLHAHGPGILHTKNKAIKTMADLKGLKFRGHGTSAEIIKALGANPVPMPMPELYQSLQKGVVEGALYPLEVNKGWKMGEVTDYTTACFSIAYTSSFYVVMNKDKWASIPSNLQKTIQAVNQEWIPKHGEAWDSSDVEGIQYGLSLGNDILGLDKKESAKWQKAVAPVIDNYIADMNKKGFNGKEIVEFTKKTLDSLQ